MATIFMKLMEILRGKRTPKIAPDAPLDEQRAQRGLELSNLDGDDHTTQAFSEALGINTHPPDTGRKAA